jgi:excisionase family DNA binding protein
MGNVPEPVTPPDPLPELLPELMTVPELARLLRTSERKVYDLAASGAAPVARVTGKLLFPRERVRAWIAASAGPVRETPDPRPPILLGSHDPLLDWALRQSRCGLASLCDGSLDGLARFEAREGVATGLHLRDADGGWNREAVAPLTGSEAVLIGFSRRRRGLVLAEGMAGRIGGLADLAGRRVVPRQAEAGAQLLLLGLLAEAGVAQDAPGWLPPARSEEDAARLVARGAADATLGLEAMARAYGLPFLPLLDERFDLLCDRRAWFEPQLNRLMVFCAGCEMRAQAEAMGGYDLSDLGETRWLG